MLNLSNIYYLYGLSIPFVTMGVKLGPQWWAAASFLIGIFLGVYNLMRYGISVSFIMACVFIVYLALSSVILGTGI